MSEDLISKEKAYEVLTDYYHQRTPIQHKALREALDRVPSADIDLSDYSDRLWRNAYEQGKADAESERKKGKWILDEDPHDGDCRCSACRIAIDQMHERNHGLLNALTGGKWWTFYKFCPNCGADMRGEQDG